MAKKFEETKETSKPYSDMADVLESSESETYQPFQVILMHT